MYNDFLALLENKKRTSGIPEPKLVRSPLYFIITLLIFYLFFINNSLRLH